MVSKRDWAVAKGLAKPTRGRMPAAAMEAIKKAINEGFQFDGPEAKPTRLVKTVTVGSNGKTVVKAHRTNDVVEIAEPRRDRPEGLYVFKIPGGKTFKRSHSTACARCSFSFQWCTCADGPYQWIPFTGSDQQIPVYQLPKAVITTKDVPGKNPEQGLPGGTRRPRKKAGK